MHRNIKVLLVEDDIDLRESLVECLSLNGFNVRGVGSALECYRALREQSCDIAVIDLGLPDQDGYVLTEYIRANTALKIIILTARSAVEDRIRGYGSGADLYLVKPVDHRELSAAIVSLCERALHRESVCQVGEDAEKWRLSREKWQLVAPRGLVIPLTAKELQFIEILLTSPGIPVKRETLIELLGYSDNEYANRAMDSLILRLRRKISAVTMDEPPIRTVHAVGFCFSAPVSIV